MFPTATSFRSSRARTIWIYRDISEHVCGHDHGLSVNSKIFKHFAFTSSLTATITIYTRNEVHILHQVTSVGPIRSHVNYHVGMYIIILLNIVMFRVWASTTVMFVFGSWLENTNFEPLFQGRPICGWRYSRMRIAPYLQHPKF